MSKRLELDIDCGNAAFTDPHGHPSGDDASRRQECARILREVANKLEAGYDAANNRDFNGNIVGTYRFVNGRKRVRDH